MWSLGGYSFCVGRSSKNGRWIAQLRPLHIAKPRPQIDGQDCWAGIRIDILGGPLVFPVARLYHWRFWAGEREYAEQWNNGNHWFTVKIPLFLGIFVSAMCGTWSFGVPGFYLGMRTADLANKVDWHLRLDWSKADTDPTAWAWDQWGKPIEAWPVGKYKGRKTMELTAAFRTDFRH